MVIGLYWTNAWNTSYLGINDNHIFDNTGARFNVSRVTNAEGSFDAEKFQAYSQPWVSAGYLTQMFMYFALYAASESTDPVQDPGQPYYSPDLRCPVPPQRHLH